MKHSRILSMLLLGLLISIHLTPLIFAGSSQTVQTGVRSNATGYANQRKIARSSDGTLHTVYSKDNGTVFHIFHAYSADSGTTWAEEQVSSSAATSFQIYPSIAVDSQDNIHIVWSGYGWGNNTGDPNIQYRVKTSAGWLLQESVTDKDDNQYKPSIAVDSQDNIHVVWYGWGWGSNNETNNIQYRMRDSTTWLVQESVTDKVQGQESPSIAVDSQDNLHVVWRGRVSNTGDPNIQYRVKTSAGWLAQESVTDKDKDQYHPSIAVDSQDNIHVVWFGLGWGDNLSFDNIRYRMRDSIGWQAHEGVTDKDEDQSYPSIAVDSQDNLHVVWYGYGWGSNNETNNIQYCMRDSKGWQQRVGLTDRASTQSYPVLIWAEWPDPPLVRTNVPEKGYSFVYTSEFPEGEHSVIYHASDDLTWGDKETPQPEPVGGELISYHRGAITSLTLLTILISSIVIGVKKQNILIRQ